VFGGRAAIADAVRQHHVDEVVIAVPSAPSAQLRGIVESARGAGVTEHSCPPGVNELLSTGAGLKDIRDVNLDDLLGRPPVTIAMDALAAFLANRRVLVTGAAGRSARNSSVS